MKKIMKSILVFVMSVVMMMPLTGCDNSIKMPFFNSDVTETPSVSFGFKQVDTASDYNESLSAFEVGKRFYTCIQLTINTDDKTSHDYKVVITVPKTKEVEMEKMGGLNPDSNEWVEDGQLTKMTFTVKGYKEATAEKIMFYGTPTGEGEAEMTVNIYDEDGEEINTGYSRKIFFECELNTGD